MQKILIKNMGIIITIINNKYSRMQMVIVYVIIVVVTFKNLHRLGLIIIIIIITNQEKRMFIQNLQKIIKMMLLHYKVHLMYFTPNTY
eukprot:UN06139